MKYLSEEQIGKIKDKVDEAMGFNTKSIIGNTDLKLSYSIENCLFVILNILEHPNILSKSDEKINKVFCGKLDIEKEAKELCIKLQNDTKSIIEPSIKSDINDAIEFIGLLVSGLQAKNKEITQLKDIKQKQHNYIVYLIKKLNVVTFTEYLEGKELI